MDESKEFNRQLRPQENPKRFSFPCRLSIHVSSRGRKPEAETAIRPARGSRKENCAQQCAIIHIYTYIEPLVPCACAVLISSRQRMSRPFNGRNKGSPMIHPFAAAACGTLTETFVSKKVVTSTSRNMYSIFIVLLFVRCTHLASLFLCINIRST